MCGIVLVLCKIGRKGLIYPCDMSNTRLLCQVKLALNEKKYAKHSSAVYSKKYAKSRCLPQIDLYQPCEVQLASDDCKDRRLSLLT